MNKNRDKNYYKYLKYLKKYNNLENILLGGALKDVSINVDTFPYKKIIDAINDDKITEVKKLLSRKGVNINRKDNDGNTLLHYAVKKDPKIVELLIKKGANINIYNKNDEAPIHSLIKSKLDETDKLKILNIMFEHNTKINKVDGKGNTALHLAVKYLLPDIVRFLLGEDAKENIKNKKKETPLEMAERLKERVHGNNKKKIKEIIALLGGKKKKKKKDKSYALITNPLSPITSPTVILDDTSDQRIPTVITTNIIGPVDKCSLGFKHFIIEYFGYNSNDLLRLLDHEGKAVKLILKCSYPKIYKKNIDMGVPKISRIEWNQIGEFWQLYNLKLERKIMGQSLGIKKGECWSEPTIDLYLLFLMLKAREIIINKKIRICARNVEEIPERMPTKPKNMTIIDPSYQININDGSDHANLRIRQTFEDLIKMLKKANRDEKIKYISMASTYHTYQYIYVSS